MTVSEDEVMITASSVGIKLKPILKVEPSSASKGRKKKGVWMATRSSQQSLDNSHSPSSLSKVLTKITKVFSHDMIPLPEGCPSNMT